MSDFITGVPEWYWGCAGILGLCAFVVFFVLCASFVDASMRFRQEAAREALVFMLIAPFACLLWPLTIVLALLYGLWTLIRAAVWG